MNRKKAQRKAFALMFGAILCVLLILGGIGFGVYSIISKTKAPEPEVAEAEPEIMEEVKEISEPQIVEEPEIIEEPVVSENTVVEEKQELTEEQKLAVLDEAVTTYMMNMTLEQKVAGLFFVTPGQLFNETNMISAGSSANEVLIKYPVGGILLDEHNMEDEAQLKNLVSNLQSFSNNNMFVAVKENGGESSSFIKSGLAEGVISDPNSIGEANDSGSAYSAGITFGNLLKSYGFDTIFGPIADVSYNSGSYTAKDSFGSDLEVVKDSVRNVVHGEVDQNLKVCVGYFPGYGDITSNPSGTRPVSSRTADDIKEKEYPIYKDVIRGGADFIMVSQIAYKPITEDVPACLSSEIVTDMLRTDLEYDGIIVTDYMSTTSMAQHYKHADSAVMAIEAGCDMIFSPGNFQKAYNGILDAVNNGELTEERIDESIRRIYRAKLKRTINYDTILE